MAVVVVIVMMVMAVVGHCVGQPTQWDPQHRFRAGLVFHHEGPQLRRHLAKLVIADTICTADQHKIGSLQPILEQLINGGEVIKAGILEGVRSNASGSATGLPAASDSPSTTALHH